MKLFLIFGLHHRYPVFAFQVPCLLLLKQALMIEKLSTCMTYNHRILPQMKSQNYYHKWWKQVFSLWFGTAAEWIQKRKLRRGHRELLNCIFKFKYRSSSIVSVSIPRFAFLQTQSWLNTSWLQDRFYQVTIGNRDNPSSFVQIWPQSASFSTQSCDFSHMCSGSAQKSALENKADMTSCLMTSGGFVVSPHPSWKPLSAKREECSVLFGWWWFINPNAQKGSN